MNVLDRSNVVLAKSSNVKAGAVCKLGILAEESFGQSIG